MRGGSSKLCPFKHARVNGGTTVKLDAQLAHTTRDVTLSLGNSCELRVHCGSPACQAFMKAANVSHVTVARHVTEALELFPYGQP